MSWANIVKKSLPNDSENTENKKSGMATISIKPVSQTNANLDQDFPSLDNQVNDKHITETEDMIDELDVPTVKSEKKFSKPKHSEANKSTKPSPKHYSTPNESNNSSGQQTSNKHVLDKPKRRLVSNKNTNTSEGNNKVFKEFYDSKQTEYKPRDVEGRFAKPKNLQYNGNRTNGNDNRSMNRTNGNDNRSMNRTNGNEYRGGNRTNGNDNRSGNRTNGNEYRGGNRTNGNEYRGGNRKSNYNRDNNGGSRVNLKGKTTLERFGDNRPPLPRDDERTSFEDLFRQGPATNQSSNRRGGNGGGNSHYTTNVKMSDFISDSFIEKLNSSNTK